VLHFSEQFVGSLTSWHAVGLLTGSVLLLDPSVASDPTFQEHWADAGALRVEVSTDAIVLRRVSVAEPEPDRSDR